MSKPSQRANRLLLLSLSTVAALALFSFRPDWLISANRWYFDVLARNTESSVSAGGGVAIVEIDDRSLQTFGRWPWPRRRIAELVDAVAAGGPAAIGLSMMFPEPDDGDEILAGSLHAGRAVAGYYFDLSPGRDAGPDCVQHPMEAMLAPATADSQYPWFHDAPSALCNAPAIADSIAGSGFLNVSPDPDGVLRRVPLLISHRGAPYPSFALATVLSASPARQIALRRNASGFLDFRLNDRIFSLDNRASLLPHFPSADRYRRLSAAEVLATPEGGKALAGRIVFLAVTANGLADARLTNMQMAVPGIEVHAAVAANLLEGGALRPVEAGQAWELLLLLTLGVGSAVFFFRPRSVTAVLAGLAALVATVLATPVLFAWREEYVSPFLPLGAFAGNVAAARALGWFADRERSRQAAGKMAAANEFMLAALASLTALRDLETGSHLVRVQLFLRLLCRSLAAYPRFQPFLTAETIALLVAVAPIHDIGKIGIPDGILKKSGPLTPEETELIRQHVGFGRQVLERARDQSGLDDPVLFEMCRDIVYSHHERWDGLGYPNGLKGDEIPIPARLLAIVDVYDALATRRVYKPAYTHDIAIETIAAGRGTHFDPDIVDAFLANRESFRLLYETHRDEERANGATA